jgi:hypothetical protein
LRLSEPAAKGFFSEDCTVIRSALLAATALALSACASAGETASNTPPSERDCFRSESVSGYSVVDEHNIRVTVGARRTYTLSTNWNVNDLDWSNAIALRSPTGWICQGPTPGLEVTGGRPPRTFPIQSVTLDPPPPGQEGS